MPQVPKIRFDAGKVVFEVPMESLAKPNHADGYTEFMWIKVSPTFNPNTNPNPNPNPNPNTYPNPNPNPTPNPNQASSRSASTVRSTLAKH